MTKKFTPKKIALVACTVAVLAAGAVMYMKSAAGTPADGASVRHQTDQTDADADPGGAPEGSGADTALAVIPDAKIYVDIAGAVQNPGVVEMDAGSRVFQAIEAAGGQLATADASVINLAAPLNDGEHIYVPTKEEVAKGTYAQQGAATGGDPGAASQGDAQGKININTADATALQQLNGVGPSTAQKILDYRNSNGKFTTIEQLKNVSGIGEKTFEKLKEHICV
ncbi:MAG: helix-hairpin-helix domain-containing protein [Clostridiales Family XIII bacterium]|nr:helix-hairpin-helix domain-containing protein [Clostridiales Family XIII bacterium]